jgi:copper(I)-binding protein
MATQPSVSQNNIEPLLIGAPVALNAVAETIAQDSSSVMPVGTVLGRINVSTGQPAAISQANPTHTGTGVITMDANQPCQLGARAGVYTIYFTGAAAGYVTDPAGVQIGAAFTSLPNPWTQQIKFVITGTPAAGDVSTITLPSIVQTNPVHSGSGVITMDATTPVLYGAQAGAYQVVFTGAAAGYVLDPNGKQVGGAFTTLPNPFSNEIKFVATGTPTAGDICQVFITAGTGKLKRFVSTNFDGSQIPEYVIIGQNSIDATGGDVSMAVGTLLKEGTVNPNALVLQNEPLQSYVPLQNMRVSDILMQAGFTLQAGGSLSAFDN